ncbi:MAG: HPr(Ser) kinase/phosphatase [Pseudomonadota bacterium]|jgi:HPr kinase/phosphorylase|nr:HPr(Ser) kinase/phosphatase [Gammaproteobacteria bacterium]MBU1731710.1 HPr(Ser) kinase/phosphatase [Gammaproteobacteria bacterium]MBU1892534.1 HPr(Ser) kinase/phosphatase [Gammaproteobacteria bacterium]
MPQISVNQLFSDKGEKLGLTWVAGKGGGAKLLTSDTVQKLSLALIGYLNFVHPNRVQVLGCAEMDYLRSLTPEALNQSVNNLFSTELAAIIIANGETVPQLLKEAAERTLTPLFTSHEQSPDMMNILRHYLAQVLAESTVRHGVFMEVQGMGVLITGDSAVGKSELALELITRGHRLVADDVVEFYQISPDTLEGRCPEMLQDFLEVRGLGVLNIRALFGEDSIKLKKNLRLIVHLEKLTEKTMSQDRLQINAFSQQILDTAIPEVRIPVAAGRNIAVLVEVAARNHILQLRGINSTQQFIERHDRMMAEDKYAN